MHEFFIKMDQPFYIISNASLDIFPNNTLTEFKNSLPKTLSFQENDKWEVGIETIGLSSMFQNVIAPKPGVPAIFASLSYTKLRDQRLLAESDVLTDTHLPLDFNLTPKGMSALMYAEMTDKYYTKADVYSMCRLFNAKFKAYCDFQYDGQQMTINFHDGFNAGYDGSWIFLHENFAQSFGLKSTLLKRLLLRVRASKKNDEGAVVATGLNILENTNGQQEPVKRYQEVNYVEIGTRTYIERKIIQKGETYFGYYLPKDTSLDFYGPLISETFELVQHTHLPELIKVQCDNIEPQIINNRFSQDLLVLSTDIQYTNNYYYHDIKRISYVPLLFNDISEIKIKLVDENDEPLKLLKGHATIVKLRFRKNKKMTDNFYVRVTSKPNAIFPSNTCQSFTVQLPTTKILNEDWKVSLNSINIPNRFTTFLPQSPYELRTIIYKTPRANAINLTLSPTKSYTPSSLCAELNHFFTINGIGIAMIDALGRLVFDLREDCTFALGLDVAKVLGYQTGLIPNDPTGKRQNFMFVKPLVENEKIRIVFESPINVNYFRPNYFIVYSNIVQPSVIANQYSPILKIVPILETENAFKLHDFNVREFYRIPNSEINEIKMELRTHDGELVNFLDEQHVVMNLQFTNETNPS